MQNARLIKKDCVRRTRHFETTVFSDVADYQSVLMGILDKKRHGRITIELGPGGVVGDITFTTGSRPK